MENRANRKTLKAAALVIKILTSQKSLSGDLTRSFPGTNVESAFPPPILTLNISVENARLILDRHLGATPPYTRSTGYEPFLSFLCESQFLCGSL